MGIKAYFEKSHENSKYLSQIYVYPTQFILLIPIHSFSNISYFLFYFISSKISNHTFNFFYISYIHSLPSSSSPPTLTSSFPSTLHSPQSLSLININLFLFYSYTLNILNHVSSLPAVVSLIPSQRRAVTHAGERRRVPAEKSVNKNGEFSFNLLLLEADLSEFGKGFGAWSFLSHSTAFFPFFQWRRRRLWRLRWRLRRRQTKEKRKEIKSVLGEILFLFSSHFDLFKWDFGEVIE